MNEQELIAKIENIIADKSGAVSDNEVKSLMELIKQEQALREIDARIEELESFCGHSNEIPETEIKARVKELQTKLNHNKKGNSDEQTL